MSVLNSVVMPRSASTSTKASSMTGAKWRFQASIAKTSLPPVLLKCDDQYEKLIVHLDILHSEMS